MQISSLNLTNFRNFSSKKFVFDPKLTVVVGANGSGKSNMLEAIGLLGVVRAKKVDTDLDLVKFGKSEAKIEGELENLSQSQGEKVKLVINLVVEQSSHPELVSGSGNQIPNQVRNDGSGRVRKAYFVDGIKKRLVDFTNYFSLIVFEPSDLDLVSGSPTLRRHHLDQLLSACDKGYWREVSFYSKVVVRRNKVLGRILEGKSKKNELDFWDARLLEHGKNISKKRQEFFEFLNFVNAGRGNYSWELKQSLLSQEKLFKNRERDIAAGVTLSGPHRDDFIFVFRGKNLEFFGSRGEQRMAVLALKIAELEYYASIRGRRPILGLDDIFSELDWDHREAVLSVVEKQQTIITVAEEESLPKQLFKKASMVDL